MVTELDIFISSKMLELKAERDALYDLLPTLDYGDIKLRAWVFEEDAPASEDSIRSVYLKALQDSALYIGLFWNQYGEYTIDEFDKATEWGMERHIYVKDVDADQRDPKLADFLNQHGDVATGITAKWFKTTDELCAAVTQSIEFWATNRLRYRGGATYTVSGIFAQKPADIPDQPEQLIGRDSLQDQVQGLLDGGKRVLLLQGFSGMGKTALAATIAAAWVTENGPVLWMKAGQAESDALFEGLARAIGQDKVVEMARAEGDAKSVVLQQILTQSSATLLVIDDAWEGEALAPILQAIPNTLPTLLTSRIRHSVGEIVPVAELDPPAALKLLEQHAGASYADTADDSAEKLCQTLGYHAYAIEIAGKTIKVDQLTAAELLSKIDTAPHDLNVPNDLSAPDRRSVAYLIEVSLNALQATDESAYTAFMAMGAFFAPSITPELLHLFMHTSIGPKLPPLVKRQEIDDALTTLSRRGLAEKVPATQNAVAYYQIHDLAYSYARAQNSDDDHNRAAKACIAFTHNNTEDNQTTRYRLAPEIDNLAGAVQWFLNNDRFADSKAIIQNAHVHAKLFVYYGLYSQIVQLLEKAMTYAEDPLDQVMYLGSLGDSYKQMGQYHRALSAYEEVRQICRKNNYLRPLGNAVDHIGEIYARTGYYDQAIEFFEQSISICNKISNQVGKCNSLLNKGNTLKQLGKIEEAEQCYQTAYEISQLIEDVDVQNSVVSRLANLHNLRGQYEQAIELYRQLLDYQTEVGDKPGQGRLFGELGNTYCDQGLYDEAIDSYSQCLAISQEIGDRRSEGYALSGLGNAYLNLKQNDLALVRYKDALIIQTELRDQSGQANTLSSIASVFYYSYQFHKAFEYHQQSFAINLSYG